MSSFAKDRCASSECGCDVVGECSWGVQTESDVVVRRRRLMRVVGGGLVRKECPLATSQKACTR